MSNEFEKSNWNWKSFKNLLSDLACLSSQIQ